MARNSFCQEAIVLCCKTISKTATQLGLEQYNLQQSRYPSLVEQLERINEIKCKLYNLEIALEELHGDILDNDFELEDDTYVKMHEAFHAVK